MTFYNLLIIFSCFVFSESNKKILILGDSLTEGYGVEKKDAFPSVLEQLFKNKSKAVTVVAAGSSGSTTASASSRLSWHLKSKPDLILLALGGNDGLRGVKVEASEENLSKAIELAKKNNIKIVLAGMKLPLNYGEHYRKSFEKIFENLSKKHNIKLIPFLLEGQGGIKSLTLADGIHPNEQGHKIIAENIFKIIESEL